MAVIEWGELAAPALLPDYLDIRIDFGARATDGSSRCTRSAPAGAPARPSWSSCWRRPGPGRAARPASAGPGPRRDHPRHRHGHAPGRVRPRRPRGHARLVPRRPRPAPRRDPGAGHRVRVPAGEGRASTRSASSPSTSGPGCSPGCGSGWRRPRPWPSALRVPDGRAVQPRPAGLPGAATGRLIAADRGRPAGRGVLGPVPPGARRRAAADAVRRQPAGRGGVRADGPGRGVPGRWATGPCAMPSCSTT